MPLFSTADTVNFVSQTLVSRAVSAAIAAGVNSFLVPTQIVLDLGIAITTTAATFLIMTTAKLAIGGAAYVGEKTYNGVMYYFYQPSPATDLSNTKKSEWDLMPDSPLKDEP